MNLNQPINLPWKLQMELVNRSLNTTFSIRKKQEIGYITSLNEGLDELKVKYTKHCDIFLKKTTTCTFVYTN